MGANALRVLTGAWVDQLVHAPAMPTRRDRSIGSSSAGQHGCRHESGTPRCDVRQNEHAEHHRSEGPKACGRDPGGQKGDRREGKCLHCAESALRFKCLEVKGLRRESGTPVGPASGACPAFQRSRFPARGLTGARSHRVLARRPHRAPTFCASGATGLHRGGVWGAFFILAARQSPV
jgi:hypothetical protein